MTIATILETKRRTGDGTRADMVLSLHPDASVADAVASQTSGSARNASFMEVSYARMRTRRHLAKLFPCDLETTSTK